MISVLTLVRNIYDFKVLTNDIGILTLVKRGRGCCLEVEDNKNVL